MKDQKTNNSNNQAQDQATERAALYVGKSNQGNTLTIYSQEPLFLVNGVEWTKSIQPRRKTKEPKKGESGPTLESLHFNSCYITYDKVTNTFPNVGEEAQAVLIAEYNKRATKKGEPLFSTEWREVKGQERAKSKNTTKSPKLYKTEAEALAEPCVFEWHIAEFHIMREKATMRAEDNDNPLTLAKYRKAKAEAEKVLEKATADLETATARWTEAKAMSPETWADYVAKTLEAQNLHSITLKPELSGAKALAEQNLAQAQALTEAEAKAKAESEARAKAEAKAEEMQKAIAQALASGDLQALASLLAPKE